MNSPLQKMKMIPLYHPRGKKNAIQDSSRPSNGVGSTESIPAAQSSETSASTLKKRNDANKFFLHFPTKEMALLFFGDDPEAFTR